MQDKKATPLPLTRRQALKTLAALTGAAALANLPNNWTRPQVAVGSLPALAQNMSGLYIDADSLQAVLIESPGGIGGANGVVGPIDIRVQFDYYNAVGAVVLMDVTFDWAATSSADVPLAPSEPTTHMVVNNPNGTPGHIDQVLTGVYGTGNCFPTMAVFIKDASGAQSNTVSKEINVCDL